MGYTVDYDKYYKEDKKACGDPFSEILDFLSSIKGPSKKVLDLGCGQGRDAIPMAEMGFSVLGVDVSSVGLKQLDKIANKRKLAIRTFWKDVVSFKTKERFDVILIDRVLHILPNSEEREIVLARSLSYLKKNGYLLIADTARNIKNFKKFISDSPEELELVYDKKSYLFYKKI